jgi:hypothetical protein
MLKHLNEHWRSWLLVFVAIVVFCLIAISTNAFQECMKRAYYEGSDYEPEKGLAQIFQTLNWTKACAGDFLREDGEAITAFFTLALSLSTIALWLSTRKVADAAREAAEYVPTVEGAYIFVEPEISSTVPFEVFDNSPLGTDAIKVRYVFTNYGKTPAIIQSIETHFEFWPDAPDNTRHLPSKILGGEVILKPTQSTDGTPRVSRAHSTSLHEKPSMRAAPIFGFTVVSFIWIFSGSGAPLASVGATTAY